MKALFIGGTGILSSACSQIAVQKGIEVFHLNRGISSGLRNVDGVRFLKADIRDMASVKTAISNQQFDVVIDWIAFEPEHVRNDIGLFRDRTAQYVFISSASVYQTPPLRLPVTELTPAHNPFWKYSQDKIACENLLHAEQEKSGFPFTIVRPSHTYDKTLFPFPGGYTTFKRMLDGKKVVIHGDGSSVWVLTHNTDFAVGLVGLLGKKQALGEIFHITNEDLLNWDRIYQAMARVADVELHAVHVPSEVIARYDEAMGASLLGDKAHSMIFDNSKIRNLVPEFKPQIRFEDQGASEIAEYYLKEPTPGLVDSRINDVFDRIIFDYGK